MKSELVKKWVDAQMEAFKGSREDVLTFIANILYQQGPDNIETIRSLFMSGYCYYFALMLKDAFGGEIYWHKGFGHIVWKDSRDDIYYDADGVFYEYNDGDVVPASILNESIEIFKHRGRDSRISDDMEKTAKEMGISLEKLESDVYNFIPIKDRVHDYQNKGDILRYWFAYKQYMLN